MRLIVQRVSEASVKVDAEITGSIPQGLVVLLAVSPDDTIEDIKWLVHKLANLRIFSDDSDKMNLSILDINGFALVISQFTLFANTRKGNRPSYIRSAKPDIAIPMYEIFVEELKKLIPVETGIFAADMKLSLINDGPVTIIIDSKNRDI